jgi:ABC-type Fe3+ transport system permease subunit
MKLPKYTIATTELLLIFPAVLFMTALFVRNLQPQQYEPAHTAQQIVTWYAARPRMGLWVLLIALPLGVLITGGVTLLHRWSRDVELRQATRQALALIRAHLATLLVAGATVTACGILAIVGLHVLTD